MKLILQDFGVRSLTREETLAIMRSGGIVGTLSKINAIKHDGKYIRDMSVQNIPVHDLAFATWCDELGPDGIRHGQDTMDILVLRANMKVKEARDARREGFQMLYCSAGMTEQEASFLYKSPYGYKNELYPIIGKLLAARRGVNVDKDADKNDILVNRSVLMGLLQHPIWDIVSWDDMPESSIRSEVIFAPKDIPGKLTTRWAKSEFAKLATKQLGNQFKTSWMRRKVLVGHLALIFLACGYSREEYREMIIRELMINE